MKIFLSTHGSMASGMLSSLTLLSGQTDCLTVFDAYLDPEKDLCTQIQLFVDRYPAEEKLLISDLPGGSVNHDMMQYIGLPNTHIITGISLPLLLELVVQAESDPTAEELDRIIEASRQMTRRMVKSPAAVPEQELFD